jgi:hypothetical protein
VSDPQDDHHYDHSNGGWVDTDTEEEPMELPDDHPEVSIQRSQVAAMRALQEEMVVIQVPQMETRIRVMLRTPMH